EGGRHILKLEADTEAATRHLVGDPIIGPLIHARPGLRALGTWDPFETGVRAIVGQQVSVAGAGTITARLVQRQGTPVPGLQALGLTHLFPSPSTLAAADLSGLGLTSSRQSAIKALAQAVADRVIPLGRGGRLDRLISSVTTIAGLGPWTAHYIALRLGEPDAFPATDIGLRRSLSHVVGRTMPPSDAEEVADRWRPWRAHAAIHLWLGD